MQLQGKSPKVDEKDVSRGKFRQLSLELGHFLWPTEIPDDENWTLSDDGFWGKLPSLRELGPGRVQSVNVTQQHRMGPVQESNLERIPAVVPQGHNLSISIPGIPRSLSDSRICSDLILGPCRKGIVYSRRNPRFV